MYSNKVEEHFRAPKNMGVIEEPDAVSRAGNPVCGDVMEIYLKVEEGRIKDIKFKTFGCAAAVATSSMMTTLAKGKTIEEAKVLTFQDVEKELGGLPPVKVHCAQLAIEALKKAIADYESKN